MAYFCIPHNEKLIGYWDTVEERLFNIRNCMNIDGIVQELPLFAPPIDPELLVRATAAGLDIDTVLADLYAPLLPYRFNVLVQKANEICAEVKSLGAALLAALEKRDAESLALLRSSQEIEMLNLMTYIKEQQVKEAKANVEVVKADYQATQNMVLFESRSAYAKFEAAKNLVKIYETGVLPQAQAALETARLGYEADKIDFLDLLDSQRTLREFQMEYFESLANLEIALADLERSVGADLTQ